LFDSAFSIAKNVLGDSSVFEGKKINPPLLLLGLVYHEVCCSMEIEPDSPTTAPQQLIDSLFGIKELKEIESCPPLNQSLEQFPTEVFSGWKNGSIFIISSAIFIVVLFQLHFFHWL
jgi:hypothetical protein